MYTTRELDCRRDGLKIYTRLYLPDRKEEHGLFPLVVLLHGYNGTCEHGGWYAEALADAGAAAVLFDFCGGAEESQSDGSMLDMSVCTELQDLWAVLEVLRRQPEIDPERIFLMGRSQGGLVAAMAAAEQPGAFRGLILLYPAFNIPQKARDMYESEADVPERVEIFGATIGRRYYKDIVSIHPEELQAAYAGPVLILQGQKDDTVPPQTAEDAAARYADARLIRLPKGGHGFYGEDMDRATAESIAFVLERR